MLPVRICFFDADVVQQGWIVDPSSQMFTVKKQPVVKEQKLDRSKLQNLTEYVFCLEHWQGFLRRWSYDVFLNRRVSF